MKYLSPRLPTVSSPNLQSSAIFWSVESVRTAEIRVIFQAAQHSDRPRLGLARTMPVFARARHFAESRLAIRLRIPTNFLCAFG